MISNVRAILILVIATGCLSSVGVSDERPIDFDRDVRPILSDKCYHCHGPDESTREADLRLDTRAGLFGGGNATGPHPGGVIVPGKPGQSELLARIMTDDEGLRMPPVDSGRSLTAAQQNILRRWVQQGAKWTGHWAFEPIKSPAVPRMPKESWSSNAIDRFVLKQLEERSLSPSPRAKKSVWLRRVTFDLTGLPPTPEEYASYLADQSPLADARVIDRLLASPRYGEHMATVWLDAARYADSNGYQQEKTRTMWPWRDWVIDAYNANQPFDAFTIEQLAGDLLPAAKRKQIIATGFNRNHMLNGEGGRIAEESRVDYVVDRVETTATVWLGLTMGCARCHDHKYDPLSQNEFYRFFAFFNSIDERGNVDRGGNANPVLALPTPEQTRQRGRLQQQLKQLEQQLKQLSARMQPGKKDGFPIGADCEAPADTQAPMTSDRNATQRAAEQARHQAALEKRRDAIKQQLDRLNKSVIETMVMRDRKTPRETYRLIRGQWDKPDRSQPLKPNVPEILPALPAKAPENRLTLARWLVDERQPLTARVAVNREWQRFFGRGLVSTPEDFGSQGERPTHPQLLDWLAADFVRSGWDVKRLHRLIVSSTTYRQSSRMTPAHREHDPVNQWLSRGPRFRLTAQMLRDQALALSGLLVEKRGGPPVKPYQPAGVWQEMTLGKITYKQDHGADLYRRSVYTFWRRSVGPTMFFDTPARQVCSVRVMRTNTPLHALTLLNETGFVEAARVFAARAINLGGDSAGRQIGWAFHVVTGRQPEPRELQVLVKTHQRLLDHFSKEPKAARELLAVGESPLPKNSNPAELAALTAVMSMILNLDEAVTRE